MNYKLLLLLSIIPTISSLFTQLNLSPAFTNDLDAQCLWDLGFNISTLSWELKTCVNEGFEDAQMDESDQTALRLTCEDKVTEKCWQKYSDPINRCLSLEAESAVEKMLETYFAGYYSLCEDNGRDFKAFRNKNEAAPCAELRSYYQEECQTILTKIEIEHLTDLFTKDHCKIFMQYRLCHAVDSTDCPVLREAYQTYLSHAYDASPCNQYSDI